MRVGALKMGSRLRAIEDEGASMMGWHIAGIEIYGVNKTSKWVI